VGYVHVHYMRGGVLRWKKNKGTYKGVLNHLYMVICKSSNAWILNKGPSGKLLHMLRVMLE